MNIYKTKHSIIATAITSILGISAAATPAFASEKADLEVDWRISQDWGSGYQGQVTVHNASSRPLDPWSITVPYANNISSTWDAIATTTQGGYRFIGPTWSKTLQPGQSVTFGFIGSSMGSSKLPSGCLSAGASCTINGSTPTVPDGQTTTSVIEPSTTTPPTQDAEKTSGSVSVALTVVSDWGTGRTIDMEVTNDGTSPITEWNVSFPWQGMNISMWNAQSVITPGNISVSNLSWNGSLQPGQSAKIGFTDSGTFQLPTYCESTTLTCQIAGTTETDNSTTSETVPEVVNPVTNSETTIPEDSNATSTPPSESSFIGTKKIVAYYPSWATYARNYQVADIPAEKITHINFAFANIADGKCVVGDSYADTDKAFAGDSWDVGAKRGNFNQLTQLKQTHPDLQTLISIGGWTWSKNFSSAAATAQSRQTFVASCVDFMNTYGFDGIDIDWEYPVSGGLYPGAASDKANYTALLAEFKKQLAAETAVDGESHPLTIAAPAGPTTINNLEAANIGNVVDWMNLMSYDFHGGWDSQTGHNAPMFVGSQDTATGFSIKDAVEKYISLGFPANKLVLGLPLYGRGWMGVNSTSNGLYQTGSTANVGTWENGVFDYTDIKNNYLPTMTRYWDVEAQVPYLYDPQRGLWISYDDPESIKVKVDYINEMGLGGAMLWELSGDRDEELLDAINMNLS